jgi:hypothetical protein
MKHEGHYLVVFKILEVPVKCGIPFISNDPQDDPVVFKFEDAIVVLKFVWFGFFKPLFEQFQTREFSVVKVVADIENGRSVFCDEVGDEFNDRISRSRVLSGRMRFRGKRYFKDVTAGYAGFLKQIGSSCKPYKVFNGPFSLKKEFKGIGSVLE